MSNKKLLKQKRSKEKVLLKKLLKAIKSNNLDDVYILNQEIVLLYKEIKELENNEN